MQLVLKTTGETLRRYCYYNGCAMRNMIILSSVYSTSASKCKQNVKNSDSSNLRNGHELKKRKILEVEVEMMRQSGEFYVPEKLSEMDWTTLLAMRNLSHRKKFVKSIKKREISIASVEKKTERFERLESDKVKNNFIYGYDTSKKSIFCVTDLESKMDQFYNRNLAHALQFGQEIVFDVDYSQHMTNYEIKNCVNQLKDCYLFNKIDKNPFHVYFCNVNTEQLLTQKLFDVISPESLVTMTESSYLNIFPRERLVYLTPDSNAELTQFNHNDVYVIGCVVESGLSKPLSLRKAKKEGIRTARLPFDRLTELNCGQKCLTLDRVLKILLSAKSGGNWISTFLREASKKQHRKAF